MNAKYILHKIGGFILVALLLSGVAILSSATVQAQTKTPPRVIIIRPIRPFYPDPFYHHFDRYNYYSQYVFSNAESAANQGYKDGLKTGSKDARKGKTYDPERSHYYHDAGFGNFAEAYREGFMHGYQDGFRG